MGKVGQGRRQVARARSQRQPEKAAEMGQCRVRAVVVVVLVLEGGRRGNERREGGRTRGGVCRRKILSGWVESKEVSGPARLLALCATTLSLVQTIYKGKTWVVGVTRESRE